MKHRKLDRDQERVVELRKQIDLMREQRAKHVEIIEGASTRRETLLSEIEKRERAIVVLRAEIDALPIAVARSEGVSSRLGDGIATLAAKVDKIHAKRRKKDQLGRLREKLAELK